MYPIQEALSNTFTTFYSDTLSQDQLLYFPFTERLFLINHFSSSDINATLKDSFFQDGYSSSLQHRLGRQVPIPRHTRISSLITAIGIIPNLLINLTLKVIRLAIHLFQTITSLTNRDRSLIYKFGQASGDFNGLFHDICYSIHIFVKYLRGTFDLSIANSTFKNYSSTPLEAFPY